MDRLGASLSTAAMAVGANGVDVSSVGGVSPELWQAVEVRLWVVLPIYEHIRSALFAYLRGDQFVAR